MRRTPREDRDAHNERLYREYMDLVERYYPTSQTPAARADGMPIDFMPNEHRTVRVSESSWLRSMEGRTRAYTRTPDGTIAPDTVRVTRADGSTDVVPSRGFGRDSRPSQTTGGGIARVTEYEQRIERFGATGDVE